MSEKPMTRSADSSQLEFEFADLAGLAARESGLSEEPSGVKFDSGKPMFSVLDPVGLLELGRLSAFGALKYGLENWKELSDGERRFFDAGLRHALKSGLEDVDPESNVDHLVVAAWNFLAAYYHKNKA